MRILLAEDDELLGDGVKIGLTRKGYAVDWMKNGNSAEQALKNETFDIIVLDIGLPKISGLELLRGFRGRGGKTPVLLLTARDTTEDLVKGLDAGADDYLTKPFDLSELYARLRALQRRSTGQATSIIQYGKIALDTTAHTITLDGELVMIGPKEFTLIQKLLQNAGRVLSRDQLAQSLYSWDKDIDSNALEVHIHNLRKKLGSDLIVTIRGVGYMVQKLE